MNIHLAFSISLFLLVVGITWAHMNYHYVFINPIFTASAYQPHGFYDYYSKKCDSSCLTVEVRDPDTSVSRYADNHAMATILSMLGIPSFTDSQVNDNPHVLDGRQIIVLHEEYLTQTEFDYLNSSNTVFLYPNSMYAKVSLNQNNTITLIRGHDYPTSDIHNGFNWTLDNSALEKASDGCSGQHFYTNGGHQFYSCYPNSPNEVFIAIWQLVNLN